MVEQPKENKPEDDRYTTFVEKRPEGIARHFVDKETKRWIKSELFNIVTGERILITGDSVTGRPKEATIYDRSNKFLRKMVFVLDDKKNLDKTLIYDEVGNEIGIEFDNAIRDYLQSFYHDQGFFYKPSVGDALKFGRDVDSSLDSLGDDKTHSGH